MKNRYINELLQSLKKNPTHTHTYRILASRKEDFPGYCTMKLRTSYILFIHSLLNYLLSYQPGFKSTERQGINDVPCWQEQKYSLVLIYWPHDMPWLNPSTGQTLKKKRGIERMRAEVLENSLFQRLGLEEANLLPIFHWLTVLSLGSGRQSVATQGHSAVKFTHCPSWYK